MGLTGPSGAGPEPSADLGPSGLEQPDVIDYVVEEADGTFSLVAVETRPWDGGRPQIDQLMAKVNAYAAYLLDGQLTRDHPGAQGRPVRVVLQAFYIPVGDVTEALGLIREALAGEGIGFDVTILGGAGF